MPRDLGLERERLSQLIGEPTSELSRSGPMLGSMMETDNGEDQNIEAIKDLHPYAQILGSGDIESCIKLEEATFPPHQRCSREKFVYRLSKCSELCLGLFIPSEPASQSREAETASTARAPDSFDPERVGVLVGHVIATKTFNTVVKDDDMKVPEDWQTKGYVDNTIGHQEHGRTIGVHSLAILPSYQKRGLGTILMKAYIQRMKEAEVADRIALLTYDRLVPFYEQVFGFHDKGKSNATFGEEAWNDMVLEFGDDLSGSLPEDFDE